MTDVSTTSQGVILRVKEKVSGRWYHIFEDQFGHLSHDGIGCKIPVRFVIRHWSVVVGFYQSLV